VAEVRGGAADGTKAATLEVMEKPPVVAVINSTPDVIDMLRLALEGAGIATVSAFTHDIRDGQVDIEAFVSQHDPKVVVYDIAPPYANNWLLFQHIANLPVMQARQFVLTTTNKVHVEKMAASVKLPIFEIVGLPYDLNQLVEEVRQATRARAVR
jgi:DNA-binding NtrC family response regulator